MELYFGFILCNLYVYYAPGARAISGSFSNLHEPGTGIIHLDEVRCTGTELTLSNCSASRVHDCIHREDAGVYCEGM